MTVYYVDACNIYICSFAFISQLLKTFKPNSTQSYQKQVQLCFSIPVILICLFDSNRPWLCFPFSARLVCLKFELMPTLYVTLKVHCVPASRCLQVIEKFQSVRLWINKLMNIVPKNEFINSYIYLLCFQCAHVAILL